MQSIYTDFRPYRLISVGSILRNLFMSLSLRLFARNINLLDVSYNSYTKFYENLEKQTFLIQCHREIFGQSHGQTGGRDLHVRRAFLIP